jgi:queuosine precursor transporter
MKFSIAYLVSVVLINIGFVHVPLIHGWPPMSLAVGLVFVLRDFAQREVGHRVIGLMLIGAALSYVMASPEVAVASCAAYLAGELVDWLVYTFAPWPLSQRVLASSLLGTPIDSAVFLGMLGFLSWPGLLLMTASKMLGALAVAYFLRRQKVAA